MASKSLLLVVMNVEDVVVLLKAACGCGAGWGLQVRVVVEVVEQAEVD